MKKTEVAKEFRLRYGIEMPTKQLARIMYAEHKLLFKDVEAARLELRRIEGKCGKKYMNSADERFILEGERPKNPFNLPKSHEDEVPIFYIDEGELGIIADLHIPYHSVEAITTALEYFKENKINTLLINGDFFDFYGGSRFMKDPRKMNIAEEIQIGCELLNIIHEHLGCKILFKIGNHDARFEHFLWQKLPEISQIADLQEIKDLTLEKIVKKRCPDIDIQFVGSMQIMDFCGLSIVHGHEFGQSVFSPVNVARGLFLRGGECVVGAHHHQTSEHTQPTMRGKMITTWSIGALCGLKPEYLPINKWNHGFMHVTGNDNKFKMRNYRILEGVIL